MEVITKLKQGIAFLDHPVYDGVLHAIEVVAHFYKVQYEHIKLECSVLCICVCFKFLDVYFCQELAKLNDTDKVTTNIKG